MSNLTDLRGTRNDRAQKLLETIASYKNEDGTYKAIPDAVRDEIAAKQRELHAAGTEYSLAAAEAKAASMLNEREPIANALDTPRGVSEDGKSIGEYVTDSAMYKAVRESRNFMNQNVSVSVPGVSFKTTMTTAAGYAPANNRTNITVAYPTRRPMIQQYIPQVNTDLSTVKYMLESTFTNNVAAAAQNAVLGESALAYTETSVPVELLGAFLPVTEQQIEDVPGIQAIINDRLMHQYDLYEESQIIGGSGSTPQLIGAYNATNVQTQAKGADDVPSAIFKAMTLVGHTGFAEPTLCILHPNDWQDIKLLKDSNGNFIWGSPAEAGPESIWGLPVLQTTAATENTGLVGDFANYAQLWRNRGAQVFMGLVADDFKYNRLTLKVTGRVAAVWYRGQAFCKITGI